MKKLYLPLFISLVMGAYGQQANLPGSPAPGMVWIYGGTFTMGSPEGEPGRSSNEGPQHQVTVSSFYMGRYPVTQAEYQEVMGANPSNFKGPNLPVERVSWLDAVQYCNGRSLKEGLSPAYTVAEGNVTWNREANGYRLPTEAEWEYACRAGTQTPFYSGASVDEAGWHSGNSERRTHPVGEKQPNLWGLYDMHGNVLEWCWDRFGNYSGEAQTDPQGPASGNLRVYRGGCWNFEAHVIRSAYRYRNNPNVRNFMIGFRVARSG